MEEFSFNRHSNFSLIIFPFCMKLICRNEHFKKKLVKPNASKEIKRLSLTVRKSRCACKDTKLPCITS